MEPITTRKACWVIVPVKNLNEAKSRLAGILSPRQRQILARGLSERLFKLLRGVTFRGEIEGFVVVSNDLEVLALAETYQAKTVLEKPALAASSASLNKALSLATRWLITNAQPGSLVILPSDLPLIEVEDIEVLLSQLEIYPGEALGVIVPDRQSRGTNALLLRPPDLPFVYQFGEDSFKAHFLALKKQPGLRTVVLERPRLALDLDLPEDLKALPAELRLNLM